VSLSSTHTFIIALERPVRDRHVGGAIHHNVAARNVITGSGRRHDQPYAGSRRLAHLHPRSAGVTVKGVVGLVVLAGIVGGALLGALMRRRPSMKPSRSLDSDRIDVQAGWRNMQGG
jgi:hypothetical protein